MESKEARESVTPQDLDGKLVGNTAEEEEACSYVVGDKNQGQRSKKPRLERTCHILNNLGSI